MRLRDDGWNSGGTSNIEKNDAELPMKGLYVKKENFTLWPPNKIYTFTSASSNFRLTTYAFQ
jgi:hypothetical protein